MLHLQPVIAPESDAKPAKPYAEAVSRLASVRHALRLVDDFGGGPASDGDAILAETWDDAGKARQRLFDRKSAMTVQATAAGIEALLGERGEGREPHEEASRALVEEIRRELEEVSRTLFR